MSICTLYFQKFCKILGGFQGNSQSISWREEEFEAIFVSIQDPVVIQSSARPNGALAWDPGHYFVSGCLL